MFRRFFDNKYTQISMYVVIVAMIIISFYAIIDNIPYFFEFVVDKLSWIIHASKPLIIAIIFAYLLEPIVVFFERIYGKIKFLKNRKKICRIYSAITVAVLVIAVLATVLSVLVFTITDSVRMANINDLVIIFNRYLDSVNSFYNMAIKWLESLDIESKELQNYIKDGAMAILNFFKSGSGAFASSVGSIAGTITSLFIAFVMTVYLMMDGQMIIKSLNKVVRALCSDKVYRKLQGFINDADEVFSGYIRGQFTDAIVMMALISVGLSIINVKFAIIIGIFAGLGNLIPYVGPFIAYGGTVLVSLFTGEWKVCLIAIIYLIIVQFVDGNIIGPKLLSNSIMIHPLLVILFIVFGNAIGGLLGMLLAVPVGALIKVIFMRYIERRLDERCSRKNYEQFVEPPKMENDKTVAEK